MKRNPFRLLLAPFALLYGIGISLRNLAYSTGLFKSTSFDIPIVCIGNLSTGGTGKTPHTEYLVTLLKDKLNIATLSRGYGRKTDEFILSDIHSTAEQIGDEPKQIKNKFPEIPVAVDAKRVNGINKLREAHPELDLVLLDDAFQHRAVKPEFSILLTPYSDLFINDYLLPVGNLREWKSGYKRADIVIVTKCPEILSPLDRRAIKDDLKPYSYQSVYFSYFKYGEIQPADQSRYEPHPISRVKKAFVFTGIANSSTLTDYLNTNNVSYEHRKFSDHHSYSKTEIEALINEFNAYNLNHDSIILTTEKDYMRIKDSELEELFRAIPLYYIPIEVAFHGNDGQEMNAQITDYVRKNQIHRSVSQGQHNGQT